VCGAAGTVNAGTGGKSFDRRYFFKGRALLPWLSHGCQNRKEFFRAILMAFDCLLMVI
jgi:hypothetical protein